MIMLVYLGLLLILIGSAWLAVVGFQTGRTTGEKALWVIVNLICQPIGGTIFYIVTRAGLKPLILVMVGALLTGIGYPSLVNQVVGQMPQ